MLNTPTQVPSTKANTPSQIANTELDTLVQKLLCHPHLQERKWEKLLISLAVLASEWVISSVDVVASERSDFLQSSKIYFQICTNNCKVKVTFDVVFWCIMFHSSWFEIVAGKSVNIWLCVCSIGQLVTPVWHGTSLNYLHRSFVCSSCLNYLNLLKFKLF